MSSARRRAALTIAVITLIACGAVLVGSRRHESVSQTTSAGLTAGVAAGSHTRGKAAPNGRRIAGVVVSDDLPVGGATLELVSKRTMSGLIPAAHLVADARGHFDFGSWIPDEYVVVAEMPHLTGAFVSIDLRDPTERPPPDQLRLELHACDASIRGTIRDAAGGIVPRARVSRAGSGGVEAGQDGGYELCVPAGEEVVSVKAEGYAEVSAQVTAFGHVRRDFSLVPEATVVGRVVRADDRSPVAGAIVVLEPDRTTMDDPATLYASSDADGYFHVDGATPGRHLIVASADGLATAHPISVIAEIGTSQEPIVCALVATRTISGRVVEHGPGTPLAGVAVSIVGGTAMDHAVSQSAVTTQSDGAFVIEHVFPGEYWLFTEAYSIVANSRSALKVTDTDVAGVVLEVESLASVSGRISRLGKPIEGALVSCEGAGITHSDHDGRYTLGNFGPGTHQIYAESQRIGAFAHGPTVSIAKGEHKTGVDIELDLAASIAGRVVDQNGAPVGGALLTFSLLHAEDHGSATTDDDGNFTVKALSGGGDYVYEVRSGDGAAMSYPPVASKRFPPIAVRDAGSHVTGLRISVRIDRLSIAGRVIDGSGNPVSDVAVRATQGDGRSRGPLTATTDVKGVFTLHDLPAGTYDLHATAARGDESETTEVAAGRTDVVIRLSEVGSIDGRLEGFTETPEVVVMRTDGNTTYQATVAGDAFRVRNLPAGAYHIAATASSGVDFATVVVSSGAPTALVLHERGFGVIVGTVSDTTTHAPLAALDCMDFPVDRDAARVGAISTATDANGTFRFERAVVGESSITCFGDMVNASGVVEVVAGRTARVDLTAEAEIVPPRGQAGMQLEYQLGDVMVKSVVPEGPAERAGVVVGDLVLEIDHNSVRGALGRTELATLQYLEIGTTIELTIERGDEQRLVQLTIAAAP